MNELPIDHGWAWVTCLGAGGCMFFVVGGLRSLGILFVEFLKVFEAGSALTALMMGLIAGGMSVLCPIANAMGARYSNRVVMMAGGVILFFASFLTAFATNIMHVIIVFGVLTGCGYGCLFGTSLVIVGQYFNKRRSLANGLAMAGGSIGQLCIPQLVRYLLDNYSFLGALWINGAVALHVIAAAALCRPLSFYKQFLRAPKEQIEGTTDAIKQPVGGALDGSVDAIHNGSARAEIAQAEIMPLMEDRPVTNSHTSLHSSHVSLRHSKTQLHKSSDSLRRSRAFTHDSQRPSHHGSHIDVLYKGKSVSSLYLAPMQDFPEDTLQKPTQEPIVKPADVTKFHSCMTLCCMCIPVKKVPTATLR